jgi:ABC-type xylose transport system substrate-binding protein
MRKSQLAVFAAAGALLLAACGGSSSDSADTTAASGGGCVVGVSWNNYQEERWAKWDEPAIKAAIEAAGGTYISNDAKSSAETQASNLENLISQGAKALIVLAQDGTAILPAVTSAIDSGIPVVAYDRLIEEPRAFYLTFDNQGVGRIEAEEIFKRVPKGKYVIIKGNQADANSDFLRAGYEEVIGAAVAAVYFTLVSEIYTGTPQSRRPPWSRSSPPKATRLTPFSQRTTAWPVAQSQPSKHRVSQERSPCRVRMPSRQLSTALRWEPRP